MSSEQQSTPYKYTSKEQDKETGWYYYGERYLDVRLSRWIAADPPLRTGDYLLKADDLDTDHDYYHHYANDEVVKLPGMGGVYNYINLDGYQYGGQNPVRLVDADGNFIFIPPAYYAAEAALSTVAASPAGRLVIRNGLRFGRIAASRGGQFITRNISRLAVATHRAKNVIQATGKKVLNQAKAQIIKTHQRVKDVAKQVYTGSKNLTKKAYHKSQNAMESLSKASNNAVLNSLNKTSTGRLVLKNPLAIQNTGDFTSGFITPPAPPKNRWERAGLLVKEGIDRIQE